MFIPTYFIIFDHSNYYPLSFEQIELNGHQSTDILPVQSVLDSEKEN